MMTSTGKEKGKRERTLAEPILLVAAVYSQDGEHALER